MRILSNNIYWLQGYPSPNNHPDPASIAILDELRQLYATLNLDVLCLQEIQNLETYDLLATHLERTGVYCPGNRFSWYGGAVFAKNATLRNSSSICNDETDRFWALAEINTAIHPLSILTLHLPSNLNRDYDSAVQKRQDEISHILNSNTPDIICGDFNQPPNEWLNEIMSTHDYSDAARFSGNTDCASCVKTGNRIDHFWVKNIHADKVISLTSTAAENFTSAVPGRSYISDHLPLVLDINL